MLEICRVCLSTAVAKNISELKVRKSDSYTNSAEILSFCLDIQVDPNSKCRLLCLRCFERIILYFRFKKLALKNDAHFRKAERMEAMGLDMYCDEEDELSEEDIVVKKEDGEENCREIVLVNFSGELVGTCNKNIRDVEKTYNKICKVKEEYDNDENDTEQMKQSFSNVMQEEYLDDTMTEKDFLSSEEDNNDDEKDHTYEPEPSSEEEKDDLDKDKTYEPNESDYEEINEGTKIHIQRRNKDGTFDCVVCNKNFIDKESMKKHRKEEHGFLCHFCSAKFLVHSLLVKHLRTHTQEKPYPCPDCPKRFGNKESLKHHQLIHKGVKPYRCEVCDKTFRVSGTRKLHMLTHTGERKFECHECGKRFSIKGNLRVHLRNIHKVIIEPKKPL